MKSLSTPQDFLTGRRVWISTSAADSTPEYELLARNLILEVCRYIFAAEGRVAYGGDLRSGGLTYQFYEAAARHTHSQDERQHCFLHTLSEASYGRMRPSALNKLQKELGGFGSVEFVDRFGRGFSTVPKRRPQPEVSEATALAAMRRRLANSCDALIAFGGRVAEKPSQSGVFLEIVAANSVKRPVYVLGGFGGIAAHVAAQLSGDRPPNRLGIQLDLNNGLADGENRTLMQSPHFDEVIPLLLLGLRRTIGVRAETAN